MARSKIQTAEGVGVGLQSSASRHLQSRQGEEQRQPSAPQDRDRRKDRIWLAAVGFAFLASLLLYGQTMAPTVYALDSAELTTAAATGGLAHATGYPLYLLIGRFWSLIPIGDVGFRMNLLSGVCGALTVALVVCLLRRLGAGPWAALCAAGFLASTTTFWAMSLVAEVYTLHTALMCGVILALLRWADAPSNAGLAVAAGLLGLAAGNHASSLLLVPGCLIFVLVRDKSAVLKPAAIASATVGLLSGLSVYLYLPILYLRQPAFNYLVLVDDLGRQVPADLTTVKGLVWTMSGGQFSHLFFSGGGWMLPERINGLFQELWRSSFVIGFGPALLGIWLAFRRSRALGGMLLVTAVSNAAFFISYGAQDANSMYLPVFLVWSVWIGLGLHFALEWAHRHGGWVSGTCLAAITVGAVTSSFAWSYPLVDLSDDWTVREHGEAILEVLETDAVYLGSWTTAPVIDYLRLVEGRRPDVNVINRFHAMGVDLSEFLDSTVDVRPVYSDSAFVYGREDLVARADGPIFRIERRRIGENGR